MNKKNPQFPRKLLIFVFIGLISIWFFKNYRIFKSTSIESKTTLSKNLKSKIVAKSNRLMTQKNQKNRINEKSNFLNEVNSSAKFESAETVASTNKSFDCWQEQLNQVEGNPDFVLENQQELNKLVGPWFYDPKEPLKPETKEKSVPGLFLLAMAKVQFVEPALNSHSSALNPTVSTNRFHQALEILRYISKADPENSAPYLFAAQIQKQLGDHRSANELLRRASLTKRFDTYESIIRQKIFSAVDSESDLKSAIDLSSKIPIVNTAKLKPLLSRRKHAHFAIQMMDSAEDPIHEISKSDFSEALTYTVGQMVLEDLGLINDRKTANQILAKKIADETCSSDSFQNYYNEIKEWQRRL